MHKWKYYGSQRWELSETQAVSRTRTKKFNKKAHSLSCLLLCVNLFPLLPLLCSVAFPCFPNRNRENVMSPRREPKFICFYVEQLGYNYNNISFHGKHRGLRLIELNVVRCLSMFPCTVAAAGHPSVGR